MEQTPVFLHVSKSVIIFDTETEKIFSIYTKGFAGMLSPASHYNDSEVYWHFYYENDTTPYHFGRNILI